MHFGTLTRHFLRETSTHTELVTGAARQRFAGDPMQHCMQEHCARARTPSCHPPTAPPATPLATPPAAPPPGESRYWAAAGSGEMGTTVRAVASFSSASSCRRHIASWRFAMSSAACLGLGLGLGPRARARARASLTSGIASCFGTAIGTAAGAAAGAAAARGAAARWQAMGACMVPPLRMSLEKALGCC